MVGIRASAGPKTTACTKSMRASTTRRSISARPSRSRAMRAARPATRVAGHPVILSALFDDGGVLRGAAVRHRSARARPSSAAWRTCCGLPSSTATSRTDGPARIFRRPRARRPSAASSSSSAARSRRPSATSCVEAHFLRKPGQSDNDPVTGEYRAGAVRKLDALRNPRSQLQETDHVARGDDQPRRAVALRGSPQAGLAPQGDGSERRTDRGNGMNPSRFGIFTFGSDCASSTSSAPITPLR